MPSRIERHESPLGRWLFAEARPASLASYVERIWYFEGFLEVLRERHFPDGRAQVVLHFGPLYRRVGEDGRTGDTFPRVCVAGLQTRPDVIEAPPAPSEVLGIVLRPAGAYSILGHPLHDLTDRTVDLDHVAPGLALEILELCGTARSPSARLAAAVDWLEKRFRTHPPADGAVAWMAEEIERRSGAVSIGALRERVGWSKSRLARTFREQIGVAPKALARTVRFRTALERLNRLDRPDGGESSLVEIALAGGYYDQPHFNGEFRALSGFTPTEYLARRRYPESPSLAEGLPA